MRNENVEPLKRNAPVSLPSLWIFPVQELIAFGSDPAGNANTVIHGITPSLPDTMATQQT